MTRDITISASTLAPVLLYTAKKGIDPKTFLSGIDIDPTIFESLAARVTTRECDRIIQHAIALTGDNDLGLHFGESNAPGGGNIVFHLMMSCSTIGDALKKFCIYQKLVTDLIKTTFSIKKDLAVLEHFILDRESQTKRELIEWMLSSIVTYTRLMTGREIPCKEVRVTHQAPKRISEHKRIFQAPILFGQEVNALVFEKRDMDAPLIQSNPHLLAQFEKHAKSILSAMTARSHYTSRVIQVIEQKSQGTIPKIESVARELGMTVRNLQLKLKEENTSYRMLLDDIRITIAKNHLSDKEISITEIAYLIGFSEPCVFHRAFKKWTGLTPNKYRKHQSQKP